jgi:hypothetical protein
MDKIDCGVKRKMFFYITMFVLLPSAVCGGEYVCPRLSSLFPTEHDCNDVSWRRKYIVVPTLSGIGGFVVAMGTATITYVPYYNDFGVLLGTYSAVFIPVTIALPLILYRISKNRCNYCPTQSERDEEEGYLKLITNTNKA